MAISTLPWFPLATSFSIDVRTLALFRIAFSLVLLSSLVTRAGGVNAFYTDSGVLPRVAHIRIFAPQFYPSLHLMSGTFAVQAALLAVALVAAVCLLIGFRTFWATLISWVLLVSLHNRNVMVVQGGDVLERLLLFWSLFLPLGARWSFDCLLNRQQNSEVVASHPPKETSTPPCSEPMYVLSVASVAILLQVCFVYWFTAALKSDASWRTDGSALYYALSIDQMVKPLGSFLLNFPSLLRVLSFGTIILECVGPLLALLPFWRLRTAAIGIFIGFHIIIGMCLSLGVFTWVSSAAWLLFLPSQAWDWLEVRSTMEGRLKRMRTTIHDLLTRFRAAMNWSKLRLPAQPSPNQNSWTSQSIAAFFLIYILCWNVRSLDIPRYRWLLPQSWNWIGQSTGTQQYWNMFAPFPRKKDGWFIVRAQLADGSEVDLAQNGASVQWDKPSRLSSTFPDMNWQKYTLNLWSSSNARHRVLYLDYLKRKWEAEHSSTLKVKSVELIFMLEKTLPHYQPSRIRKVVLYKQTF